MSFEPDFKSFQILDAIIKYIIVCVSVIFTQLFPSRFLGGDKKPIMNLYLRITSFCLLCWDSPCYIWSMKHTVHPFVKDRSQAKINLSWADLGDLVIKHVFETGLGSRHAVTLSDQLHRFVKKNIKKINRTLDTLNVTRYM